jgi:hypothetical protein
MKWFLSSGAWYLWLALDNPEDWEITEHRAEYKKGLTMWISNGASFFDGYDAAGTPKFLGWFERHIVWWKYKRMIREQTACHIARLMTN